MVVSSCASYNPKNLTPSFIDTDRMTFREYHVVSSRPTIEFDYTGEYPLLTYPKSKGGLMCLPIDQAMEMKRAYEKQTNRQHNNVRVISSKSKIQNEKQILSGVDLTNACKK